MKKRYLLIACVLLSMMLTSCGVLLRGFLGEDRDGRLADKATNDLCRSIKDRDKAAVKKLFSEKACSKAENIDAQIEELFAFIDGEVVAWKRRELDPMVKDDVEYGQLSKQEWFWVYLKTEKDVYAIYLSYYPIHELDPENEGIYSLLVVRAADKDRLEEWSELPGINIQQFQDETQESTRTAVPLGG